jgi:hypothetical protein
MGAFNRRDARTPEPPPVTGARRPQGGKPMAQQTGIIEESYDRLQEAFESVSEEIESLQKRVAKRRKTIEKDARKQVTRLRKELSASELVKRAEKFQKELERDLRKNAYVKRAKKFQESLEKDIEKSAFVKRARKLRKDASKQVEARVDDILGTFQIATSSDVKKLERKLGQINKKLKELEKARASQPAAPRSQTLQ